MIKHSKGISFYLLILFIVFSYIIFGTELFVGIFAEDATEKIKFEFQGTLSEEDISHLTYPVKISIDVSCKIEVITPGNEIMELNFPNIQSNGTSTCFSQIFVLDEMGEYQFKETYKMILSNSILNINQTFILESGESEKIINDNPLSTLVEFRLIDMYINNYDYNVSPEEIEILIDPTVARPGDTVIAKIKIEYLKGGEPALITIFADWHKISSVIIPPATQKNIQLKTGWNLITIPVAKCFYEGCYPVNLPEYIEPVNIKSLGFNYLAEWFGSVLKPCESWSMLIGEDGAMSSYLDPELHSLKYISPLKGYWVKIKDGIVGAVLSLDGLPFHTTNPIALKEGWNLVGYPIYKGYCDEEPLEDMLWITSWEKVNGPVAKHVFKSIENKYSMIIGESGIYNPVLSEEFNSLHYILPSSAYWVKAKEAIIIIPESGQ